MALDLLVRRKQHKCCAVKHSVYFLIGELSSFLLQYLATERAATHTDAGLFQWEFGAFCSTFLLNFFTIQFLLVSLLSFWLYFSRWIVWTLLSSPLTALVCCSFFPCSYPLYLEWNLLWRSFEEMSFEIFCSCFVWSSSMSCTFDILLSAASVCTLHAGHFYPSFSVLLLLRNELFSLLELVIHWWLFSFFGAWRSVMVEWPALVFFF